MNTTGSSTERRGRCGGAPSRGPRTTDRRERGGTGATGSRERGNPKVTSAADTWAGDLPGHGRRAGHPRPSPPTPPGHRPGGARRAASSDRRRGAVTPRVCGAGDLRAPLLRRPEARVRLVDLRGLRRAPVDPVLLQAGHVLFVLREPPDGATGRGVAGGAPSPGGLAAMGADISLGSTRALDVHAGSGRGAPGGGD